MGVPNYFSWNPFESQEAVARHKRMNEAIDDTNANTRFRETFDEKTEPNEGDVWRWRENGQDKKWTPEAVPVPDHNDLGGLQGGTEGEYYHLTLAEKESVAGGKVKADGTDPTPGFLSDKADGVTLEVDTTGHKMQVKSGVFAGVSHDHDGRYYTEGETDTLLAGKSDTTHNHDGTYAVAAHDHDSRYYTEDEIDTQMAGKADAGHNHDLSYSALGHSHDDRYYTEGETDTLLSGKANTTHNHDGTYSPASHDHDTRYYTEGETDTLLSGKSDTTHNHDGTYAPTAHDHDSRYYTEGEIDTQMSGKADSGHNHDLAYSALGHNHDGTYSPAGHNHDGSYSALGHSHSGLAPVGGSAGQVLKKDTGDDYDYSWQDDATSAAGSDEKVKSDGTDPTAGYLSDKVDGVTLEVDTTGHKVQVKSGVFAGASHDHDGRYYTEGETDTLLSGKSDTTHDHDDVYYTDDEVDTLLSGKSDSGHDHDGTYAPATHDHDTRYYTESESDTLLSGKSDTTHDHDGTYSPTSHNHDLSYSALGHNHDGTYSPASHNHDGVYATTGHNHDLAYSSIGHNHDDAYYTDDEVDTLLTGKSDTTHNHDAAYSAIAHNHAGTYAPVAEGVSNGNSHDHSGGDGGQIVYSSLSGLPTLGNSAALDVGTGAGDVAAGDDPRLSKSQDPYDLLLSYAVEGNILILDDDCSILEDPDYWTVTNTGSTAAATQETFDGQSTFKFTVGTAASDRYTTARRDIGSFAQHIVCEIKIYNDLIGYDTSSNQFYVGFHTGTDIYRFYIFRGVIAWTDPGNNTVKTTDTINVLDQWRTFRFYVDTVNKIASVFIYNTLTAKFEYLGSGACGYANASYANGTVLLRQYGYSINNVTTYVDYIKVWSGLTQTISVTADNILVGTHQLTDVNESLNVAVSNNSWHAIGLETDGSDVNLLCEARTTYPTSLDPFEYTDEYLWRVIGWIKTGGHVICDITGAGDIYSFPGDSNDLRQYGTASLRGFSLVHPKHPAVSAGNIVSFQDSITSSFPTNPDGLTNVGLQFNSNMTVGHRAVIRFRRGGSGISGYRDPGSGGILWGDYEDNDFFLHRPSGSAQLGLDYLNYEENPDTTTRLATFTTSGLNLTGNLVQGSTGRITSPATYSGATTTADPNVYIDNTGLFRRYSQISSITVKKDVKDTEQPYENLLNLKVKDFRYDLTQVEAEDRIHTGLILEDLIEQGLNSLITYDTEGKPEGIRQSGISVLLIPLIQELNKKIHALEKEVHELKKKKS